MPCLWLLILHSFHLTTCHTNSWVEWGITPLQSSLPWCKSVPWFISMWKSSGGRAGHGRGKGRTPLWGVGASRATLGIPGCLQSTEDPRDRNQGENRMVRSRITQLLPSMGLLGKFLITTGWLLVLLQTVLLFKLSPQKFMPVNISHSLRDLTFFKRKSRSFDRYVTGYTFSHLVISPVCSRGMWQMVLWTSELLLLPLPFPAGQSTWILLLLHLHAQLPLAPSSWVYK